MKRADLEHIIRAAGAIAETKDLIVLGSQAILGKWPDAPGDLLVSQEVDTYPADVPDRADLIDGTIGELSPFHEQFGYYAHGVGPETAVLPRDWRSRLVPVCNRNTNGVTGHCLHPTDLAVSKLIAAREKDIAFVSALFRHGLVAPAEVAALLPELADADAARVKAALARCRS
jgi:hypothetical protein